MTFLALQMTKIDNIKDLIFIKNLVFWGHSLTFEGEKTSKSRSFRSINALRVVQFKSKVSVLKSLLINFCYKLRGLLITPRTNFSKKIPSLAKYFCFKVSFKKHYDHFCLQTLSIKPENNQTVSKISIYKIYFLNFDGLFKENWLSKKKKCSTEKRTFVFL